MSTQVRGVATQVPAQLADFRGDARLFKLSQPVKYSSAAGRTFQTEYVVVSAVNAYGGPETYIFAADAHGRVLDWFELGGSFRGGLDHAHALKGAGFDVQPAIASSTLQ